MVTTAPQNALTTFMADSAEEFVIVLTVIVAIHQRAALRKQEFSKLNTVTNRSVIAASEKKKQQEGSINDTTSFR